MAEPPSRPALNAHPAGGADAPVLAVVVLHEPPGPWVELVDAISVQADSTLVVANGVAAMSEAARRPSIPAVRFPGNAGTAAAYNAALAHAPADGWLLVVDQDARVDETLVAHYRQALRGHPSPDGVGVIWSGTSPRRGTGRLPVYPASGAMYRSAAVQAVGGWWEDLFVDGVDRELAIRLYRSGFDTLVLPEGLHRHRLGATTERRVLGVTVHPTRHPPWRRRGMARAAVLITRRHWRSSPGRVLVEWRILAGNAAAMLLAEPHRIAQVWALVGGLWDGLRAQTPDRPPGDGRQGPWSFRRGRRS